MAILIVAQMSGILHRIPERPPAKAEVSLSVRKADGQPRLVKADAERQIVWGEVYAPGFPDSQGHWMTEETVLQMAYGFMRKGDLGAIDTNHDQEKNGSYIVESFIARKDDPDFIPGSWVLGVKCSDPEWELVKSGELNGFSLDGRGVLVDSVLEVDIPEILKGETDSGTGHTKHVHTFAVTFDQDGNMIGGQTDKAPDGHFHLITNGTITETAAGHSHRFSFVEGVLNVQVAA